MSGARTIALKRAWDRLRSRVDADVRGCRFIRLADPRMQEWVQDLVLEAFMEGARAACVDLGEPVVKRVSMPFADAAREARFRTWPTASYGPAPYADGGGVDA